MGTSIPSGRSATSNPFGITEANVLPLLVGSTVLKMNDCKHACLTFVREHLRVHNCMRYFIFSIEECRDQHLQAVLLRFLVNNIEEIQDRAEFRNLRPEQINYLLPLPASTSQNEEGSGSGDLVESELLSKLLFSLFKWWEVDKDGRLKDFTTISTKFPLTQVDAEVPRKIYRGDDMLRLDPTCQRLYLETIESKLFAERSKSKGRNSSVATPVSPAAGGCPQISEIAEGGHEAESVDVNVQRVNGTNGNQEQPELEQLLENQSMCSTSEVGARNSEESQICVDSGEDSSTTGSDTGTEISVNTWQELEQPHEEPSVSSEVKFSDQTPGGSRGQKRPAQDDDVELLGVVPIKRNVIAEVDLTIADSDSDVSSSNVTTGSPKPKLYFVSGLEQKHLVELDMTDFSTKNVAIFPFKGNSIHLLYNAGKIYSVSSKIINSNGREKSSAEVRFLDLRKEVWVHGPNLKTKRHNFAWIAVDDCISVFGGMKRSHGNGFVEYLGASAGSWRRVESYPLVRRSYHAVTQMRGSIYLVGGCWLDPLMKKDVAQGWRTSTDVEVYDPDNLDHRRAWAFSSRLPESRVGHCVAAVDSSLYVIGGRLTLSPGFSETTCRVYRQVTREWKDVAPLLQARQNFSAFVIDRHIYVVGGNEGPPTMEKYDVDRNIWTLLEDCHLPLTGIYSSVAFALR